MTRHGRDLVQYAVLITLEEKKEGDIFNQAIQFSSFSKNLYCLYFEKDYIFNKPQIIIATPMPFQDVNKFEIMMLNKNIIRVAHECFNIIQYDGEWLEMSE